MRSIYDIINESVFDSEEDAFEKIDKLVNDKWFTTHATGNFKIKNKKSIIGPTIVGDIIIDKYDGETIPVFVWAVQKGSVYFTNCPNLKTIKGFFGDIPHPLDGGLYIENCPNLETLEGCPPIVGEFSCIGNKKIKSLSGAPQNVFGNCYIMKNGKKFKEDEIKTSIEVYKRIDCNENPVVANISEAFTEPHLLKLDQQLKDNKLNFKKMIGDDLDIAFDKITSKNVKTYAYADDDAIKACNQIISGRKGGFILLRNSKGEYSHIILNDKKLVCLIGYDKGKVYRDMPSKELIYHCKQADERTIIYTGDLYTGNLQMDRRNARSGMIENTAKQNKQIAEENVTRYKKLAAQIRANKDVDFERLDKAVEDIVLRVLKACQLCHRDPNKYDVYEISSLNEMIYDQERWSHGRLFGQNGLLWYYSEYTKYLSHVKSGRFNKYSGVDYSDDMEKYKKKVEDKLIEIEAKLKSLGL